MCIWIVEAKLGFCRRHGPGDGLLAAAKKYIARDDSIRLSVENPAKTIWAKIKNDARDKLVDGIKRQIDKHARECPSQNIDLLDGILYCYRNLRDDISNLPSYQRSQRALKCGKANIKQWPKRFVDQRRWYNEKGEDIEKIDDVKLPFILSLDTYMMERLKWWKLPSRGGDGGTEWYYISLQGVRTIWNDGKAYALDAGRRNNANLNEARYDVV